MKYYVILLVTYNNGDADKVGIYTYGSEAEALQNFYVYMGRYVNAENVATVNVEAKNNVGGVYKNESWTNPNPPAPKPEPEPEPTPEPEVVEDAPLSE